jgi:hypothetical protein
MNWFKQYLSRGPVDETYVKLYSKDGHERYELTIVDDQSLKTLCTYGAFIIPFGRFTIYNKYKNSNKLNISEKEIGYLGPQRAEKFCERSVICID